MKLLIDLNEVVINNKTISYRVPVDYYAREHKTYLGKRLIIKGRIKTSKYQSRPNILTGKIIKIDSRSGFFGNILYSVRNYIDTLLNELLEKELYDIGAGLVLGGSGRIKKDLRNVFSRAGILHILAVSGLHVGFVCMFAGFFLFFIPISPKIKFSIIILILCLYAGITGFRPSVCRATLMALFFGLGLIYQRNIGRIHIANITAIIFLLINPMLLFDIGTQLSFAAVYGILFFYPIIECKILKRVKSKIPKFILALMAVSFSAQLFVSPLLIYYFHHLPTLAVISNLIIVPISSVIIFLLLSSLIIGSVSFFLANIFAVIASWLINILVMISTSISNIPFASIALYASPLILLLTYFIYPKMFRKHAIFLIVLLLNFFSLASLSDCAAIKVTSLGALISTPSGENIFITTKHAKIKNAAFLNNQNIGRLDYMIAPKKNYPVEKEYFEIPDALHAKRIIFGELTINLSREISMLYRDKKIILDNCNLQSFEENSFLYILTDGTDIQQFVMPLYGSIFDQIIEDIKVNFAKLRLLF